MTKDTAAALNLITAARWLRSALNMIHAERTRRLRDNSITNTDAEALEEIEIRLANIRDDLATYAETVQDLGI